MQLAGIRDGFEIEVEDRRNANIWLTSSEQNKKCPIKTSVMATWILGNVRSMKGQKCKDQRETGNT